MSPAADLTDQELVTVKVSGFGVGAKVFLVECPSAADASERTCSPQLASQPFLLTNNARSGSAGFNVEVTVGQPSGPEVTCSDQCVLLASGGIGGGYAFTTLSFAANASFGASAVPCPMGAVQLGPATPMSPTTGQNPRSFAVVNVGSSACTLEGYPVVSLVDGRGEAIPFDYSHGGQVMVTTTPPQSVLLLPGHAAFFLMSKYRCDSGDQTEATGVKVTLPGQSSPMTTALPENTTLWYCGQGDPGSTVAVSPIEPTYAMTLAG